MRKVVKNVIRADGAPVDMITNKTTFTMTIKNWKNKMPVGKIAAQYYKKGTKLPLKHKGARLKKFGRTSYYVDSTNKRLIRNDNKAGNTKYWNLNGQAFYSTNMHWTLRSQITNFYHLYFTKYIEKRFTEPFPVFLGYRMSIDIKIYDIYTSQTPDITNMWILTKLFEDAMVNTKILRDDSPQFRSRTSYEYIFVEKEKDRKLVIKFKYIKI